MPLSLQYQLYLGCCIKTSITLRCFDLFKLNKILTLQTTSSKHDFFFYFFSFFYFSYPSQTVMCTIPQVFLFAFPVILKFIYKL